MLAASWKLDFGPEEDGATVSVEGGTAVAWSAASRGRGAIRSDYVELVHRLRHAGISVSDRRAGKLQRLMGASALLCGRLAINRTDMWVLRYIWDTEEQQDVLATIVKDALEKAGEEEKASSHPRSRGSETPDPEHLARDWRESPSGLETRSCLGANAHIFGIS